MALQRRSDFKTSFEGLSGSTAQRGDALKLPDPEDLQHLQRPLQELATTIYNLRSDKRNQKGETAHIFHGFCGQIVAVLQEFYSCAGDYITLFKSFTDDTPLDDIRSFAISLRPNVQKAVNHIIDLRKPLESIQTILDSEYKNSKGFWSKLKSGRRVSQDDLDRLQELSKFIDRSEVLWNSYLTFLGASLQAQAAPILPSHAVLQQGQDAWSAYQSSLTPTILSTRKSADVIALVAQRSVPRSKEEEADLVGRRCF